MLKTGAATAHPSFIYNEDYFRSVSEAGIDAVEITRYAEDYEGLDYKGIHKLAMEYGNKKAQQRYRLSFTRDSWGGVSFDGDFPVKCLYSR